MNFGVMSIFGSCNAGALKNKASQGGYLEAA